MRHRTRGEFDRGRRRRRKISRAEDYLVPALLTVASLLLIADFASSSITSESKLSLSRMDREDLAIPFFMRRFGDAEGASRYASLAEIKPLMAWGGPTAGDVPRIATSPDVNPKMKKTRFEQAYSPNSMEDPAGQTSLTSEEVLAGAVSTMLDGANQPKITSGFGYRRLRGYFAHHDGIDLAITHGSPIKAAWPGVVVFSGWRSGYGQCVVIDHGNGRESLYGHASRLMVKPGQKIVGGEVIGLVGNTGRSYGSHLHFELRVNGVPIDPERHYLASKAIDQADRAAQADQVARLPSVN